MLVLYTFNIQKISKLSLNTTRLKFFLKVVRENWISPNPGISELHSSNPKIPGLRQWSKIETIGPESTLKNCHRSCRGNMPEIQNGNQHLYFGKKFTVQSFSSFNGDYFYSNNFYCFERMVWLQSAETYLIEICIFPKNLKCPISNGDIFENKNSISKYSTSKALWSCKVLVDIFC